jgi:Rv2525c-like, glycoside hydrolase-like domain/Sortilin, neurotensin receptor 3,
MKNRSSMHHTKMHYSLLIILLACLILPASISRAAPVIEVVVEDPLLIPAYTTCPATYWYPFTNDRGHTAYLTLNTNNPSHSTNQGEWHPVIPQSGYYRVEAYIAGHPPITWCTGSGNTISTDTTDARYSIHNANGVITTTRSQFPLYNSWLDLGEYYFAAGTTDYVSQTDLNGETEYSTTVSFSAMRFTYTRASRPFIYLPLITYPEPPVNPPPVVGVIQGQGFDVCTLPSVSTMQTWWNHSPYSFYGLYLGGIQLPAQCAVANATWVSAVHQQGWSFIPTWVGPQAPCSPWSHKMSADPAVSYLQGRQEAEAASNQAYALGLTNNGLGGTIIYYDMEVFGGASLACRQAASSFMNGWVERLGELGNLAGGYGARNSYITDWASLVHAPVDVWVASWYANYYDPYASVSSIPWLDGLWLNHQRIRQYAGDHHESWGGIGITIDSDVADGSVALPPYGGLANSTIISGPPIEDIGWLANDTGWLVSQGHLYKTIDRGENWQDISPAAIQIASLLPDGHAWGLAIFDDAEPTLYSSTDWGVNWESQRLSLLPDGWRPLQLQFSSASSGWIVLQKVTSLPFQTSILLITSDGGSTWNTMNLPAMGKVTFTSSSDGWLVNSENEQLFHTVDSGRTWHIARLNDYPFVISNLPTGTIISGSQLSGLAWAATSNGSCQGEKGSPNFACQVDYRLLQSVDGGNTWQAIPTPTSTTIMH